MTRYFSITSSPQRSRFVKDATSNPSDAMDTFSDVVSKPMGVVAHKVGQSFFISPGFSSFQLLSMGFIEPLSLRIAQVFLPSEP